MKKGSSESSLWAKEGIGFTESVNILSWDVPTKIIESNSYVNGLFRDQMQDLGITSTLLLPVELILVTRDSPDISWPPVDISQCVVSPRVGWQSLSPLPGWVHQGGIPAAWGAHFMWTNPLEASPAAMAKCSTFVQSQLVSKTSSQGGKIYLKPGKIK